MTVGGEVVIVGVDKSASAGSRLYPFGTVWGLGQRVASSWLDQAGRIDFIPFSASFTVYPRVDKVSLAEAIQRECVGQSTRLSGVLRYCFNDYVMWSLSGRREPTRLILVCDGEPDDIEQAELEVTRFVTNRLSTASPFALEIITQKPWENMAQIFKEHRKDGFVGYFNSHLFEGLYDRPAHY